MEDARDSRDPQPPRKSARLINRRQRQREEEKRKAVEERKRAKTMFRRKSNVVPPNDLLVDTTGMIHLGPDYVSEDVKVKVEPSRWNDSEETLQSSGSTEGQGHQDVIITPQLIIKTEDAEGGAPASSKDKQQERASLNESLVDNQDEVEGNALMQEHDDIHDEIDTSCPDDDSTEIEDGPSTSRLQMPMIASRAENQPLTAVFGQLNDEMKERLKEKDQKIAQLAAELEAVKEKEKANSYLLQKRIAELELKLSFARAFISFVSEETAAKDGLTPNNNQAQAAPDADSEVITFPPSAVLVLEENNASAAATFHLEHLTEGSQGHLIAQNDKSLQGNPDQNRSEDMAMLLPKSKDNWETAAAHPNVLDSLPSKEKSIDQRIEAPIFEAVLKVIVQQRRIQAREMPWISACEILKKCRLVCKSWKASVDSVMQTSPSHLEFRDPDDIWNLTNILHSAPCPLTLSTVKKLKGTRLPLEINPSKMGRFIMSLPSGNMDSNYNPVPTRYLHVETTEKLFFYLRPEQTAHVYKVSDYLRVFGHHIWYLRLRLSLGNGVCGNDFDELCASVLEILQLVPNLKLLSLHIDYSYIPISKRIELFESAKEYQFPHLKHLVVFECFEENPIFYQILKANSHVRNLGFHHLWYKESTAIMKLNLPNLSELSISINRQLEVEMFAGVTWKIRKLQLRLTSSRNGSSLNSLINGLAVFGDSLEDLKLEIVWQDAQDDLQRTRLKLPHLKCLHIKTGNWKEWKLDVLLAELKLLETLEIVWDVQEDALVSSFHEEQVWLTMPALRSVTLVIKKPSGDPIEPHESRKFIKLKRVGMPTVKFIYIKIKVSFL